MSRWWRRRFAGAPGGHVEDVARTTTVNALRLFRIPVDEEVRITYRIRDSLYLNITNRCTNACTFCPKRHDYRVKGHLLKIAAGSRPRRKRSPKSGTRRVERRDRLLRLRGPLLRLPMVKGDRGGTEARGARVAVNTDAAGESRPRRNILPELAGLVDALSVSLNAPDATTYTGSAEPVREASFAALLDFLREGPESCAKVTRPPSPCRGLDRRGGTPVLAESVRRLLPPAPLRRRGVTDPPRAHRVPA